MGFLTVIKYIGILKDRIEAVEAEKGDDGELTAAEIVEQTGKLCLSVADALGEDVTIDGD